MEYRFVCDRCGKKYSVAEYHWDMRNGCPKCGDIDVRIDTDKPLIYHPRMYIDWGDDFKKRRFREISKYLNTEYVHRCKVDKDLNETECQCKEKDFQAEIVSYLVRRYGKFWKKIPGRINQITPSPEGQSQELSRFIIKERVLWSPQEAIKWYTRIGTNNWKPGEMEESKHRMRQIIDLDAFNIAIEIKSGGNPTDQFRDLLAECIRDRMVAGPFVIGLYLRYPKHKEQVRELYLELFKESGIKLIVRNS